MPQNRTHPDQRHNQKSQTLKWAIWHPSSLPCCVATRHLQQSRTLLCAGRGKRLASGSWQKGMGTSLRCLIILRRCCRRLGRDGWHKVENRGLGFVLSLMRDAAALAASQQGSAGAHTPGIRASTFWSMMAMQNGTFVDDLMDDLTNHVIHKFQHDFVSIWKASSLQCSNP